MKNSDPLALAFRTVRSNKLRTGITVAIIAFGIMALVGINTAINAMKQKFTDSFSAMGANGFTIHYRKWFNFNGGGVKAQKRGLREKKSNSQVPITKMQAETFLARYQYPAVVSLNFQGTQDAVVSLGSKTTNTNASFNIQVKVADVKVIDGAIDQAEGVFRPVRRLDVMEADNFMIDKSDTFVALLLKNLSFITLSAGIIGLITLIGAAIGLMNIMLVALTVRIKEPGLVKRIVGRRKYVRTRIRLVTGS